MGIRLREKIGYGLGDTASSMLWKLFSVYLMFFYTDICGIDAWVVGVLFLVTRIWDSLLDPVVGLLCDRTSSRWGTFRPWLLWGALPFGALGVLTFYMPEWGTGGKVVYATVTYSLMMIVYSSVNVPYAALLGVMSADPHERTVLAAFRMAFAAAGSMVVVLAVEALVKAFRPWAGSSGSWTAAVAVVAVVAVLLFFVTFATTRERIRPVRTERHPVLGSLRDLLHNKPWLILAGAAVCLQVFNAFRESGTIYFFKYCVAGETVGTVSFAGIALTGSALFLAVGPFFNIAGIVSSWCIVPNEKLRRPLFEWMTANELDDPHLFAPIATMAAFKNGEEWRQQMLAYVEQNILFVEEFLSKHLPQIKAVRPQASFLVWLDCRGLHLDHDQLIDLFVNRARLALNDGEMFGKEGKGFMRMNVATPRSVLKEALERLAAQI